MAPSSAVREPGFGVRIGDVDMDRYLARIGIDEIPEPTLASLERLQRAHLSSVPFENLDVFHRRGVETSDAWSVPKIVERGRGGWCFELNGAFAALLSGIGFRVKRFAATVLTGDSVSPIPTHLTLEVSLDRPYLVDVGFGDSFIKPLPLDSEGPHDGGSGEFGFVFAAEHTTLFQLTEEGEDPQYRFDSSPRTPADFEEASILLQTKPGLQWTEARFATRLLDGGPARVTLLEDRIRFRREGTWRDHPAAPEEFGPLLREWFEMTP